ncbi:MAG TPA: peptidylprolyl isomerase [Candidatus Polarisedimenticolia bacterium]|nr:peptidylprolyl isomerase [Candidatus Polarisedimenticolia bacterium]
MKQVKWFVAAMVIGALFSGCKAKEQTAETQPPEKPKAEAPAQPKAEAPAPAAAQPGATGSAPAEAPRKGSYDRALLRPALLKDKSPETFQVKFVTTRGDFTVTVNRTWAPIGADRFYNLVKHHFYDNASFFRVVPGFVVQFGVSAYPPVSAAWDNANIQDEPVIQSNKRGYLTYAKTSLPNTRATQIFINLKDNGGLDRQGFSPFGVVDGKGMNVVDMLYDQYTESSGPDQDKISKLGKPYIDKYFPKLDSIKTATLVAPPAEGAKP